MTTQSDTKKMEHRVKEDGDGIAEGGEVQAVQKHKTTKNATECTESWDDEEHSKTGHAEYKKFQEAEARKISENAASRAAGPAENQGEDMSKKRGRGANQNVLVASSSSKKQKNADTDADGPKGVAGDKTRVPQKGQNVQWHASSGYVDGTVVEIVYEEKEVNGFPKTVKGSNEDPRIVLKSTSGELVVHKPDEVYFD